MFMKNLLFPVASAAEGREGLHSVVQVAKALAGKLTLLRLVDPFREGGPKPVGEEAALIGIGEFGLIEQQIRIQGHSDMAGGIATFAASEGMDAIVLPGRRRSWIGTRSGNDDLVRRLASESPCPIWLTGVDRAESYQSTFGVRRILCAISGRDHAVLEKAAHLSEQLGAELFVLHVVPEVHEGLLAYGFDNHVALSAKTGMELIAAMQRQCGTNGQPIVEIGKKTKCIAKVSRTLGADLIVTGRRERPLLKQHAGIAVVRPAMSFQTLMI